MINNISEIWTNSLTLQNHQIYKVVLHISYNLIPSSHINLSKLHEYSHKRLVKKYNIVPVSNYYVLLINMEEKNLMKEK